MKPSKKNNIKIPYHIRYLADELAKMGKGAWAAGYLSGYRECARGKKNGEVW